jgi:Caspase domain
MRKAAIIKCYDNSRHKLKPNMVYIFLVLFSLTVGCASTKSSEIFMPSNIAPELKRYLMVEVNAGDLPWTRTDIDLEKGDKVVILASGKVTISSRDYRLRNLPPDNRLMLKIGEKSTPRYALGQWNKQNFFEISEPGRLMFAVRDWDKIDIDGDPVWAWGTANNYYADNSGSFIVDVFVFKTESPERIVRILDSVVYNNPANYRLRVQIEEFVRLQKITTASENTNHEIEELKRIILALRDEKAALSEAALNLPTNDSAAAGQEKPMSQTVKDRRLAELEQKLRDLEQSKSELETIKLKYEEEKSKTEILSKELEEKGKREKQLIVKATEDPKIPPVLLISSPENESHNETGIVRILGAAEDDRGIENFEITLNGKLIQRDSNRGVRLSSKEPLRRISFDQNVNLDQGVNLISAKVTDTDGLSTTRELTIHHNPKNLQVWAVVIGINEYAKFPKLKFAVNDAKAVYRYLNENNRVPSENIFLLIDKQASIQNLRNILGTKLKASAGEKDMVIIYFAGHGSTERDAYSPDGDGLEKYLLAADSDPTDLYSTAMPMREVGYLFSRIRSERLVFLVDSCYSGASGGRTVENLSFRANISDKFLERISSGRGKIIITASSANEVSAEKDELQHGVFTYFLIEGLKGKADSDSDKIITVDEIYRYVSDKVPKATGQEQHPVKRGSLEGELVLGVSREK